MDACGQAGDTSLVTLSIMGVFVRRQLCPLVASGPEPSHFPTMTTDEPDQVSCLQMHAAVLLRTTRASLRHGLQHGCASGRWAGSPRVTWLGWLEVPARAWPRAPTSIGSPKGVPVPCMLMNLRSCGCRAAAVRAVLMRAVWAGPLGAVSPLDLPAWLYADPASTQLFFENGELGEP